MCEIWTILTAIGTIGTVIVALFGENIRNTLFAPRLNMTIEKPTGVIETIPNPDNKTVNKVRFYNLLVLNIRKKPAIESQVYIRKIETLGPNEKNITVWEDAIPLRWKDQETKSQLLTIGPATECDLCCISDKNVLTILTQYPKSSFKREWVGACKLIVSLNVRYKESESRIIRFRISWDGKWDDGEKEMAQHFILEEYTE